jgi:hypothetical protein
MTHVDQTVEAETSSFFASFFSGAHKSTGLFECVIAALGGLVIAALLLAHHLPMSVQLAMAQ